MLVPKERQQQQQQQQQQKMKKIKLKNWSNICRPQVDFLLWLLLLLCCFVVRPVFGKSLEPIMWSVQNKMFSDTSSSNRPTIIEVRIGEFLNIICPKYSLDESSSSIEFHALHRVSKEEFDECKINNINMRHPILKCDRPFETVKYTLYISKFSPVPDAIEFTPGNSYYFISTSNGTFSGLNNDVDGSCKTNNMKIIVKVLDLKAVSTKTTKERHKPPDPTAKPISVYYPADRPAIESTTSRIPIIILSTAQYQLADELIRSPVAVDTTRAAPTTTKTVNTATNDNIFILEPDSDVPVDYGEILSQIIFSSPSPPSLSRTTLKNSDSSIDDINDRSGSADQIEANSSQPRIACRFMVNIVLVFYFLLLLILL